MSKVLLLLMISFLSFRSFAGLTVPYEKAWHKNNLKVCWERTDENFITEKVIIKSVIESEYKIERTGVFFSGWKECKFFDNHDVRLIIRRDKSLENLKGIGGSAGSVGFPVESRKRKNLKIQFTLYSGDINSSIKLDDLLGYTALHEFGHIAGLAHEHGITTGKDIGNEPLKQVSVYNPNSVMDYHLNDYMTKHGSDFEINEGTPRLEQDLNVELYEDRNAKVRASVIMSKLSYGDIHSLKCLYVYNSDERNDKCHPSYEVHKP
jgi:hypothetical protein